MPGPQNGDFLSITFIHAVKLQQLVVAIATNWTNTVLSLNTGPVEEASIPVIDTPRCDNMYAHLVRPDLQKTPDWRGEAWYRFEGEAGQ